MEIEKLIQELNELKITQKSIDFEEDLYENHKEYSKIFDDMSFVTSGLDVDTRRWYETSIAVYQTDEGDYIGVRSISNIFSEEMACEDVYHHLEFFRMESYTTTSYKIV